MNSDWKHLQSLFHAALELETADRATYLARECAGDEALRQRVESLIAASEKSEDLLNRPAFSLGMQVMCVDSTNDLTGRLIGSFNIIRVLGSGGMGQVYLAEDAPLGRKVALKFLSSMLADDQWAKRQFIKEAQAVAMLEHPNICAVHGFEETDGYSFIVMQYIDGERLDELIERRELELKDVLSLSTQIVGALSEAHAHGIIHRDVKPPNIIVTANKHVKVLDFGLAKFVQQQNLLNAEQNTSYSARLGLIPGTVAYMSPEQLRGERLDYRTDIFSFGAVLYELVGGENPFARDNKAETISAILSSQPQSLRERDPQLPRELDRIVQKCLEKERDNRYQSASELLFDLEAFQKLLGGSAHRTLYSGVRAAAAVTLLLLLITVATFVYSYITRPHTLAVLPIANATGDAELDYKGDGLTEGIISRLSGLSKLHVKPFSTVSGYKGQALDLQKIGRDLGVDAIIAGKLTGDRNSLQLQIEMIDTSDGSQLWSKSYRIGQQGLLSVEGLVSSQIISKLEFWPRRDENQLQVKSGPKNPEAHDEYLRGREFWRHRDRENIIKAIEHFDRARELEPSYAEAYAGLADSYVLLPSVTYGDMDTRDAMTRASWAARQAIELDDTLPDAYTALGVVELRYNWNWAEAERDLKHAIDLKPDYAPAHYWYSNLLAVTKRQQESIAESATSRDLDPFSPVAAMNYCRAIYYARDYDTASSCLQNLVKQYPNYSNAQYVLGYVYLRKKMYPQAVTIFKGLYAGNKRYAGAGLGYALGLGGQKEEAEKVLREMLELSEGQHLPPQEIALIYIGLGDRDNAFAWLAKAADERFAPLAYMSVDPIFDAIRSDARFSDLAKRLNLP